MQEYISILSNSSLFCDIPTNIISHIVNSDMCYIQTYNKGITIYGIDQPITHAGLILDGTVDVIYSNEHGYDILMNRLSPGNILGISFAIAGKINLLNEIRSHSKSTVLFIDVNQLLKYKFENPDTLLQFNTNIIKLFALSSIRMNGKIQFLSQKTLRDKILAYFAMVAKENNSPEFILPFNREHLGSFLGSERCSLCRELTKLQRDGLIAIKKNYVKLL